MFKFCNSKSTIWVFLFLNWNQCGSVDIHAYSAMDGFSLVFPVQIS